MIKDEEVILTPIYKGMVYKYHECSNCKEKIYFEEDICQPFHFENNIKYCPFCGKKVIRYAESKYIKEIDWTWLDEYSEIIEKTYKFLEYKIHCKMNSEEIRDLRSKAGFGKEYFKGDRWYPNSNGNICDLIYWISGEKLHYTEKNKLKQEFNNKEQYIW